LWRGVVVLPATHALPPTHPHDSPDAHTHARDGVNLSPSLVVNKNLFDGRLDCDLVASQSVTYLFNPPPPKKIQSKILV
jgi:hypothetical protein